MVEESDSEMLEVLEYIRFGGLKLLTEATGTEEIAKWVCAVND